MASTQIARKLRRDQTQAERILWTRVRGRRLGGAKFRRQAPVGEYVADFLCREAKLIVELDGGQHSDSEKDRSRTAYLELAGYRVLRFWNNDLLNNEDGVVEQILQMLAIAGKTMDV